MTTTSTARLDVLTTATAPEAARPLLSAAGAKYGFVPNLLGVLANAPAALEGYMTLAGIFDKSSLTPTERQVVLLATSRANSCAYCIAAHTGIAAMHKVDPEVVAAIREDRPIADPKLEALRALAADIAQSRGLPSTKSIAAFIAAGYTDAQLLDVILGVTVKTLSNYTNHLADTPLDPAFQPAQWAPQAR